MMNIDNMNSNLIHCNNLFHDLSYKKNKMVLISNFCFKKCLYPTFSGLTKWSDFSYVILFQSYSKSAVFFYIREKYYFSKAGYISLVFFIQGVLFQIHMYSDILS